MSKFKITWTEIHTGEVEANSEDEALSKYEDDIECITNHKTDYEEAEVKEVKLQ